MTFVKLKFTGIFPFVTNKKLLITDFLFWKLEESFLLGIVKF